jgi:hypothetical protein
LQGDREQRHAHALAGADEHVQFAPRRLETRAGVGRVASEAEQPLGGLAHRADHDRQHVAGFPPGRYPIGDGAKFVEIREGRAAELLNDQRHGKTRPNQE